MEKLAYGGWPDCLRLFNREMELIITTDIGPRIIRCGYIDRENLFFESTDEKGLTGGNQWHIYGGHRLWHTPEVMPRTYFPDNLQVSYQWTGNSLSLTQDIESTTGIVKEMDITLDPEKNHVRIIHRLINKNLWAIETSPWAITAFTSGGVALAPQEPYVNPEDNLLPARPLVLWNYTRMQDPRWVWGDKYIQMKHDPGLSSEQKIGFLNKQGWSAYLNFNVLMVKRFGFEPDAIYPDFGCNNELYVNHNLLEVESLGAYRKIPPGGLAEHAEDWYLTTLNGMDLNLTDKKIDLEILPLIKELNR